MATLITNDGIRRVDDNYLIHWAKGSEAKNHKWIKRIWTGKGWKYQYKQASNKAKNLGNKISKAENTANSEYNYYKEKDRENKINTTKMAREWNHYVNDLNRHGKITGGRVKAQAYADKASDALVESRDAKERYNKAIREKEDAKRQQASALAAAQRAESKSVKAKAKKVIKKLTSGKTVGHDWDWSKDHEEAAKTNAEKRLLEQKKKKRQLHIL